MGIDPLAPLVDRIARSDADALSALYERTSSIAYGLILSILREEDASEDALVDVYAQIWSQACRFDPGRGSVATWIATLSRTRAIDLRRARQRRRDLETGLPDHPMPDESPGPSERTQIHEEAARVRAALDALPADQRRALEAAFYCGWSHSEVARELGQPLGTVKTRIRTGLAALRRQLTTSRGEVA